MQQSRATGQQRSGEYKTQQLPELTIDEIRDELEQLMKNDTEVRLRLKRHLKKASTFKNDTLYKLVLSKQDIGELSILLDKARKAAVQTEATGKTLKLSQYEEDKAETKEQITLKQVAFDKKPVTKALEIETIQNTRKRGGSFTEQREPFFIDPRLKSKIPGIHLLNRQLEDGTISEDEYKKEVTSNLRNAAIHDKTIDPMIRQILYEMVEKIPYKKQTGFDNQFVASDNRVPDTQQIETRLTRPQQDQNYMSSENKQVGAILPTDITSLQTQQQLARIPMQASEQIGQNIQQAYINLNQQRIQTNAIPQLIEPIQQRFPDSNRIQEVSSRIMAVYRNPPRNQDNILTNQVDLIEDEPVSTFEDVRQDKTYDQLIERSIKDPMLHLTNEQQQFAKVILKDPSAVRLINNLINANNQRIDKQVELSVRNRIKQESKVLALEYKDVKLQGTGDSLSINEVLQKIPKVLDFISKIEGTLDPTKLNLQDYKRQTEVFTSQVIKQETNQYKINSSQAFRTRACC